LIPELIRDILLDMKSKLVSLLASVLLFFTCEADPLTGENTLALVSDAELFAMSFEQYDEFLKESTVITGTPDAVMVKRVGEKIKTAAEKLCAREGKSLKDYKWEYNLVDDKQVNAWCMPGGKIVVYTGILKVTQNEDALATVMGHEVAHALLNHGKQRYSAALLQQLGALGVSLISSGLGASEDAQDIFLAVYGVGTNVGVMLPFSRENESDADKWGLYLMAIAGYNPEESVPFWERMAALGGGTIEFLSTHPSHETRINDLRNLIPEAKNKAGEFK